MNQTKRENVVFLIRILKEYLDYNKKHEAVCG